MSDSINTTAEVWKTIEEFPNYSVSDQGRVRRDVSLPRKPGGRLLRPGISSNGYPLVVLTRDGLHYSRTVHRLVAKAFLEPIDGHSITNHKDGNKENNRAVNLEWATYSSNLKHSYRFLGRKSPNRWLRS